MRGRGRGFLAFLFAMWLTLTGCGVNGLMFKEDNRINITVPQDRADISMPVVIRWKVKELPATVDSYAVFVDSAPQPTGRDLYYLFRKQPGCLPSQGCPRREDLAQRGIYETTETYVTLDAVAQRLDATQGLEDLHTIVVILLDEKKRRIGETAGRVEFKIIRQVTTE